LVPAAESYIAQLWAMNCLPYSCPVYQDLAKGISAKIVGQIGQH
jgi:hypothetical protein